MSDTEKRIAAEVMADIESMQAEWDRQWAGSGLQSAVSEAEPVTEFRRADDIGDRHTH